jgi:hypothetical protein
MRFKEHPGVATVVPYALPCWKLAPVVLVVVSTRPQSRLIAPSWVDASSLTEATYLTRPRR